MPHWYAAEECVHWVWAAAASLCAQAVEAQSAARLARQEEEQRQEEQQEQQNEQQLQQQQQQFPLPEQDPSLDGLLLPTLLPYAQPG